MLLLYWTSIKACEITLEQIISYLAWNLYQNGNTKYLNFLTAKQAVSPGFTNWICPDTAFSLTPDSIHTCPSSLQAYRVCVYVRNIDTLSPTWLIAIRASKLSTQLRAKSTGLPPSPTPAWLKWNKTVRDASMHHPNNFLPKPLHKMSEILYCSDVIIMNLDVNIRIDLSVESTNTITCKQIIYYQLFDYKKIFIPICGKVSKILWYYRMSSPYSLHKYIYGISLYSWYFIFLLYLLESGLGCFNFAHPWLRWLEEETVHVRQLNLVIVKQNQLCEMVCVVMLAPLLTMMIWHTLPMPHLVNISAVTLPTPPTPITATANSLILYTVKKLFASE